MVFGTVSGASASGGGGSVSGNIMDEIAEVKYSIWLNEYKTFGENSHVFNNKDNWREFMQSNAALNDATVGAIAFKYLLDNGIDPLNAMGNVYGTGIDFKKYSSFREVCAVPENAKKIINHTALSQIVYGHQPSYTTLFDFDNSGLWNVISIAEYEKLADVDSFRDYMYTKRISTTTNSPSDTNKFFFVLTANIAGAVQSAWGSSEGVHVCGGAQSGFGYTTISNTNVQVAQVLNHQTNGFTSIPKGGINKINKFVKSFYTTSAYAYHTRRGSIMETYNYHTTVEYSVIPYKPPTA